MIEMKGKPFARWTVKSFAGRDAHGDFQWNAVCTCGAFKKVSGYSLRSGRSQSCGCLHNELLGVRLTTHGMHGSATYDSWGNMIQRCTNPSLVQFKDWGGRGITVCKRWLNSFENFLADMGLKPKGKTLDRFPNNDGNYEPSNCRWATPRQQAANRRKPVQSVRTAETKAARKAASL